MKKVAHHEIQGEIVCVSGIRVGGSDDVLQIGGTDLSCIKNPTTLEPYIPGSSIKGKMRSELERKLGRFGGKDGDEPCGCGSVDCMICRVFGPHKKSKHNLGPTRIIVRDGLPVPGQRLDLELKPENVISRSTGTAQHPRQVERVIAGARFRLKLGLQVLDLDEKVTYGGAEGPQALQELLKDGLRELEKTGLGSGVSKGSGEIRFEKLQLDGVPFDL